MACFVPLIAFLVFSACSPRYNSPRSGTGRESVLIVNGQIFGHRDADAVLILGNRIAQVGRAEGLKSRAPAGVRTLDAEGAHVLPGFHDAHTHLMFGGMAPLQVKIPPDAGLAAIIEEVRSYASRHPEQPWILGRGWSYDIVPQGQFPSKKDLDRAVSDRPVVLKSYDGHALWLNSRALELIGINRDTPDPKGGRIAREPGGFPEGALLDTAMYLAERKIPKPSRATKLKALTSALDHLLQFGFTSVVDLPLDEGPEELELLGELRAQGRLPIRVTVGMLFDGDMALYERLRHRYQDSMLRFSLLKGFVDGVVESKTAYMVEPYVDSTERGMPRLAPDQLHTLVSQAHERGFPVALHAIGDAGVRLALDAFAEALRRFPSRNIRHRIEHIEIIHAEDLRRFRAQGVVASMQPFHANPGGPNPDSGIWSRNLGPKRLKSSFPWKDLLSHDAVLAFGSDWPVMSANPFWGLAVAVTRKDKRGDPPSGWNAHQSISVSEAVKAYTYGAAYAVGRETELGLIEPGYLADIVILSPETRLKDPASLWKGSARWVLVDGRVRHPH